MTDSYYAPDGRRALFCTTVFIHCRQHLTLEGLFPTATACGHPVNGWSTGEIRTLLGLTCRTCVRNVTKHGETRPTPFAWLMVKLAPLVVKLYDRRHPPEIRPEPISTSELFPAHEDDED
jgi:hypothetical protein